ncbi:MAG TPA: hypothetical protein VFF52_27380 [Isosphaeraceae bacterium]|nr:hypothetical protein [Isosphaeraceae bacterium]
MFTTKSTTFAYSPSRTNQGDDLSWYGTLGIVAACLLVLAAMCVMGCSGSSQAHAVDPSRAREALKLALEQWKRGAEPSSLSSSATPMTIQDFDWASGAKLIDYQLVDDGKAYDSNLRIQVKLTLDGGRGRGKGTTTEKKVWYLVGTSPAVTVFRDLLRR